MEIESTNCTYYINQTIMVPEENGLNGFYQIIECVNKQFTIRRLRSESRLFKNKNEDTGDIYEARIFNDFDGENFRYIDKDAISEYPVIYANFIQYEV
jgi:hypothetical protein